MKPLDKLKSPQVVSIIISSLILLLVVYFLLVPSVGRQVELSKRIQNKAVDLNALKASNEKYALLRKEVGGKQAQIEGIKKRLFWEMDISRFLSELTNLASDLQIEFISLNPENASFSLQKESSLAKKDPRKYKIEELEESPITKVVIEVSFRSSYANIISFLKRIEEGDKFIKIDSLSIEADPDNVFKHDVKMQCSILIEKGA